MSPAALCVRDGVARPADAIGEFLLSDVLVTAQRGNDQGRDTVPSRPLIFFRRPRFVPLRLQGTPQNTAAGVFLPSCGWIPEICVINY